jgi:hypothetical protein
VPKKAIDDGRRAVKALHAARKRARSAAPKKASPRKRVASPAGSASATALPPAMTEFAAQVRQRASIGNRPKLIAATAAVVVIVAALALAYDPARRPSVTLNAESASGEPSSGGITQDQPAEASTRAGGKPDARRAMHPASAAPNAPVKTVSLADSSEAAAAPARVASSQAPVTITGCLEMTTGGDEFRLTETDGDEAPKARGWRSGFLKRSPAPVELIAPPDPSALRKLVGHRVAATGVLDSRELRVRSFRRAGSTCS